MTTINKIGGHNNIKATEFFGLAKDKKPTGVPNGSTFYVIDYKKANTSALWMFDEENQEWIEQ